MLSHDARLRCDMVDLYYALYGSKRPPGMVSSELSAMFRPQKVTTSQTTSTSSVSTFGQAKIKTEAKTSSSSPIEEKPLHITDTMDMPYEQLVSVDDSASRESGVNLLPADVGDGQPTQLFSNADMSLATGTSIQFKSEPNGSNSRQIKEEIIDVDELDNKDEPPLAKKMKTDFHSDNSASLPGLAGTAGATTGPVGFEPGMFKQEDDSTMAETALSIVTGSSKTKGDSTQKVISPYLCLISKYFNIVLKHDSRRRKRRTKRSTNASIKASTTRTRTRRKTRIRPLFVCKRRPKTMHPKR